MSVGKRLTELYDYLLQKKVVKNKQDFCEMLGIDYKTLSRYMRDDIKFTINSDNSDKFYQYDVNVNWLLTGKGEMFKDSEDDKGQQIIELQDRIKTLETSLAKKPNFSLTFEDASITNYNVIQVPILDIKASAGYGIAGLDNPNIVDYFDISKHLLGRYNPDKVVCLEISGDSMEPDFRSGDFVLCAIGIVETNGFYVININGNILFKRLQFIKQEKILVMSINPAYQNEEITENEKEYFGIVGKVFKHIRSL